MSSGGGRDDWLFRYGKDDIRALDADAKAASEAFDRAGTAPVARPDYDHNLFVMYGQSLGAGQECWPVKTKGVDPGILMLGDCVRGAHRVGAHFGPVGEAALKPMRAAVQDTRDGSVLDEASVAALPPGSDNYGETPLEGALRMARAAVLAAGPGLTPGERPFIGANTAMSGLWIELLSRGHPERFFDMNIDMARRVKAAADARGGSLGLVALFYLQGEFNAVRMADATDDKTRYKALLSRLYDDFCETVVDGVLGQAARPLMVTYQTGGVYANNSLSVAQAQLELSQERDGWVLAAPAYPVTDKGGHLDANGSRWLGLQLGKVWSRVVVEGRPWRPVSPHAAVWRGRQIAVTFHVPCPPLQIRPCYERHEARLFDNRGFTVVDDHGAVACNVRLAGERTVVLSAERSFVGRVLVYYARLTPTGGLGNLCDSDATVAPELYTYEAGSGDDPSADIADLVGRPYPLWNWCVAFVIRAEPDAREVAAALPPPAPRRPAAVVETPPAAPAAGPREDPETNRSWSFFAIGLAAAAITVAVYLLATNGRLEESTVVPAVAAGQTSWQRSCRYTSLLAVRQILLPARATNEEASRDPCPDRAP